MNQNTQLPAHQPARQDVHAQLRQATKALIDTLAPPAGSPFALGVADVDAVLGGGLARGGVHEVYAPSVAHLSAATGFAAALAVRAAARDGTPKFILWVRQEFMNIEAGNLYALGLADLGLDPARLILVLPRDAEGVLRAGEQATAYGALGAVVLEPWGNPKVLDFTASRRLSLVAAKSGVPVVLARAAAGPMQSAAATRWSVKGARSRTLEGNAPGNPAFEVTLLRQRGGGAGQTWCVEWDRDRTCFEYRQRAANGRAPLSGLVVPMAHDRQDFAGATRSGFRKAG